LSGCGLSSRGCAFEGLTVLWNQERSSSIILQAGARPWRRFVRWAPGGRGGARAFVRGSSRAARRGCCS
jgi:hypothetical protein